MESSITSEVDIIIVGGGAAGCVLAGRLARASPETQIALLESGTTNYNDPLVRTPANFLSHQHPESTTLSRYNTTLNPVTEREHVVTCGNILGGGSSVNFMMYTRASASDYDAWNTEGWGFQDLLPLLKKTETYHPKKGCETHGYEGPINVSNGGTSFTIADDYIQTWNKYAGVEITDDVNDFRTVNKVGRWSKWIDPTTGMRSDAAHAFIHPLTREEGKGKYPNFYLMLERKCSRILFEGTKAGGVEYYKTDTPSEKFTLRARKLVVLSAGALSTPPILERSGIGSATLLSTLSIPLVSNLPAVGENYQDHHIVMKPNLCRIHALEDDTSDSLMHQDREYLTRVTEIYKEGKGPLACNFIDAGIKYRPTEKEVEEMGEEFKRVWEEDFRDKPDKALMWIGISMIGDPLLPADQKFIAMGAYLNYPRSRGSIHVTSHDPSIPPKFDAGFLSHPADIPPQVLAYKKNREILRRMDCVIEEFPPSIPTFNEASKALTTGFKLGTGALKDFEYSREDDKVLEKWVKDGVATAWHSMGTCAMKPREEDGVVDKVLNVYGTENLKLADLSICPGNVGANMYSTALLIGEKAAVIIAQELGIEGV